MSEAAAIEAPADVIDWERLWLATRRRPWTTLVLIPIGDDISTPRIAALLAVVGQRHLGAPVTVSDATGVTLSDLEEELGAIAARAGSAPPAVVALSKLDRSRWVHEQRGVCAPPAIVALPRLQRSPAGLALAQAADAAILCVTLRRSAIAEAEQVLAEVGRERVIGSLVLRSKKA